MDQSRGAGRRDKDIDGVCKEMVRISDRLRACSQFFAAETPCATVRSMATFDKQLALAFLMLLMPLVAACTQKERVCEITCKDGFSRTQEGTCSLFEVAALSRQHGSCS